MPEENKVDLRVQKTERALLEAMHALLQDKPLHAISVSDLCETAMIRRATFYKHFKDKYDFLDFCIEKKQRCMEEADARCPAGQEPVDYCVTVLRDMLRFLRDNRPLFEGASLRKDPAFLAEMHQMKLIALLVQQVAGKEPGGADPVPPDVLAAFLAGALMGVSRWWASSQSELSEAQLLGHMRTLLTHGLLPQAQPTQKEHDKEETPSER